MLNLTLKVSPPCAKPTRNDWEEWLYETMAEKVGVVVSIVGISNPYRQYQKVDLWKMAWGKYIGKDITVFYELTE